MCLALQIVCASDRRVFQRDSAAPRKAPKDGEKHRPLLVTGGPSTLRLHLEIGIDAREQRSVPVRRGFGMSISSTINRIT